MATEKNSPTLAKLSPKNTPKIKSPTRIKYPTQETLQPTKMHKSAKERLRAFAKIYECHFAKVDNFQKVLEYGNTTGKCIARTMDATRGDIEKSADRHAQQYVLKKGILKFGDKGKTAAVSELLQKHQRAAASCAKIGI